MPVGEDGAGTGADEAVGVVVDALLGDRLGWRRVAGLAVAARVAEMVEQDDRVRRQVDVLGDRRRAPVLDRRTARRGVQPEAVLGVLLVRRVRARPAVAVTEVDDDRGTLDVVEHLGPGGVGMEDASHVHAVRGGQVGDRLAGRIVAALEAAAGTDDDDDLELAGRLGRARRCRREADGQGHQGRGQEHDQPGGEGAARGSFGGGGGERQRRLPMASGHGVPSGRPPSLATRGSPAYAAKVRPRMAISACCHVSPASAWCGTMA